MVLCQKDNFQSLRNTCWENKTNSNSRHEEKKQKNGVKNLKIWIFFRWTDILSFKLNCLTAWTSIIRTFNFWTLMISKIAMKYNIVFSFNLIESSAYLSLQYLENQEESVIRQPQSDNWLSRSLSNWNEVTIFDVSAWYAVDHLNIGISTINWH